MKYTTIAIYKETKHQLNQLKNDLGFPKLTYDDLLVYLIKEELKKNENNNGYE